MTRPLRLSTVGARPPRKITVCQTRPRSVPSWILRDHTENALCGGGPLAAAARAGRALPLRSSTETWGVAGPLPRNSIRQAGRSPISGQFTTATRSSGRAACAAATASAILVTG